MDLKHELHPKTIDLVICGPDFSGTSTQVEDVIDFYSSIGKKVRDLRGDHDAALFHAEMFNHINNYHSSSDTFLTDPDVPESSKDLFKLKLMERRPDKKIKKLLNASMIKNDVSTYINPERADVWIMEEPAYRGAGETCRTVELNRKEFNSGVDEASHATSHSVCRMDEFFRFRKALRALGKTIIRSRSEESACYQIKDHKIHPDGCDLDFYLSLPGHKIAFANPPTHIFVACAPADISREHYLTFKSLRFNRDREDNLEKNAGLQMLVNQRYATNWLEKLYDTGCSVYGSNPPQMFRFDMRKSKTELKAEMQIKIKEIIDGHEVV